MSHTNVVIPRGGVLMMQQSSQNVCQLCGKRAFSLQKAHIVDKTAGGIVAQSICSSVALPVIPPLITSSSRNSTKR